MKKEFEAGCIQRQKVKVLKGNKYSINKNMKKQDKLSSIFAPWLKRSILTDKALDPSAGISPLTFCRSAVAGLLPHIPLRELWNINLFVWLLLKSLQCFPKPCRIKSRMDDKAQHDMFLYAQGKQKTPLSALHICHALSGLGWDVTHGKPPSPPMILISLAGNSLLFPMVLWNTRSSSILFTMDVQCQIQCLE